MGIHRYWPQNPKSFPFFKAWIVALAVAMLLLPMAAPAREKVAAPKLATTDLEPWLDGFMANALRANDVQGAVVAVVKDGKVVVQKGYGYADVLKKIPIDREKTLFRPGSISKLFAWTAVMQLVEQGKIDLDADINTYLDFKITGMGGKKITVRNLMTHRAGFEEVGKSGLYSDPVFLRPLGAYLKLYTPERIFEPGSTPAYSNYGANIAGYIVQRVSGMAFETYVERNIFAPLGMAHSTFRQPLPRTLQSLMSKGYQTLGTDPKPFELINDVPAGALSASTSDVVRFMIAHLNAERISDGKLLKPETAKLMHRSLIRNFPDLNGMALGFYEKDINGHNVIGHGGDTSLFHSDLTLFIDDGIGIYLSLNSTGNNNFNIRQKLHNDFADRYMPVTASVSEIDPAVAKAHLALVSGAYVSTRRLDSSFGRVSHLASELSISSDGNGLLLLKGRAKPMRYREISPYLWQEVDGKELLAVNIKDGRPVAMSFNPVAPIIEFRPVAPLMSASFLVPAILAALAVLIVSIIAWPFGVIVRKFYGVATNVSSEQRRLFLTRQAGSICLIFSASLWVILIVKGAVADGFTEVDNNQILFTQVVSILSVLVAAICVFVIVRSLVTIKRRRLHTVGVIIWLAAFLFVIWFYYSFNFLQLGADL
jgi:CubicO group peptidase (beta-lactamase class C family)